MGRRDDDRLTPDADAAADAAMRRLLARYDQPAFRAPPPGLTNRVLMQLPTAPPAAAAAGARRRRRRRTALMGAAVGVAALLLALGLWGVFGDSSGPATLLGGGADGFGRLLLVLTLAAKPLVHSLLAPGLPLLLLFGAGAVALAWLWWRLAQQSPIERSPSPV